MATWNKELHRLTREDVERISIEVLKGWYDLMGHGYSFRLKGFNHMREKYGMEPLTKEMSVKYRIEYIKNNYTEDEIKSTLKTYMRDVRMADERWNGIELFGCRFERDYAKIFRALIGSAEYRKMAEEARREKLIKAQIALYGGVGLAGDVAMRKAATTNIEKYGGANVMNSEAVRSKLAKTNDVKYGGPSPFSDPKIRSRARRRMHTSLADAIAAYKHEGHGNNIECESRGEFEAFKMLAERFGVHNVYTQYGIHPYDERYPFNCDLYIKSLDLFIELNFYYVHGKHWFDSENHDDQLRLKHLQESNKPKNKKAIEIWTKMDVKKRGAAKAAGLKYLVFWYKGEKIYGLGEFNEWFFDYDCDYERFVQDHPNNTY